MANEKRLIDANELKDEFRRYMAEKYDRERCVSEESCITCGRVCLFQRTVNNAPTVDAVEVVHGRWIQHRPNVYECTACHTWYGNYGGCDEWAYCPNCGAKMDGGK